MHLARAPLDCNSPSCGRRQRPSWQPPPMPIEDPVRSHPAAFLVPNPRRAPLPPPTNTTRARPRPTSHASSGPPKCRLDQRPRTPCDLFANVYTLVGRLRLAIHLHPPLLPRHSFSALPRPSHQAYDASRTAHVVLQTLTLSPQRSPSAASAPACRLSGPIP